MRGDLSISRVCALLGVPRSSFYTRRCGPPARPVEPTLEAAARRLFAESRQSMGSRRLSAGLRLVGHDVGRYRARRLAEKLCLVRRRRPHAHYKRYTKPEAAALNVLDRKFNPERPNTRWASDITQLFVDGRWLYMAVVMELFSRRIIGWAYSHIADTQLAEDALAMAIAARRPPPGLLFHSDQGCQYSSHRFVAFLRHHQIDQSMSRRGNCWDNAAMERFFHTTKHEWVPIEGYHCPQHARRDLTAFLNYYNHKRPHSSRKNIPPALLEHLAATNSYVGV